MHINDGPDHATPPPNVGRIALVTGAGQGVGRAIALRLAAQGARAIIVNDYHRNRAEAVAAEIMQAGGRAIAIAADVSNPKSVLDMIAHASAAVGPPTILVNNAGNAGPESSPDFSVRPFWEEPIDGWDRWFAVNLRGVMLCCHAALPAMVAAGGGGRIVTIISDAARVGEAGLEAYAAAKAGAAGFLRAIARAVGPHEITVNMVALGATVTPTSEAAFAQTEQTARLLRRYVIRRLGRPDDAAAMAAFLASEDAGWITGQTIPVNGGYSFAL